MIRKSGLFWAVTLSAGLVVLVLLSGESKKQAAPPSDAASPPDAGPAYQVQVVSFTCSPAGDRPVAKIAIRNEGPEIPYATVFAKFGDQVESTYFRPTTVPTGAMAEAVAYGEHGAGGPCGIAAIQDGDGAPVGFHE